MKDKSGKEITPQEFMQRWKEGIKQVTPLQQAGVNIYGYVIVLIGILIGMITAYVTDAWWLFIILTGSIIISGSALVTGLQKYYIYKELEETLKGGLINDNEKKESEYQIETGTA